MNDAHAGRFVRFFDQITIDDTPLVGGKTSSLGESYRELRPHGILVPNGFAVTAEAYRVVLERAGAWNDLHAALDGLDAADVADLAERAAKAREIVYHAAFPEELRSEILSAYGDLRAEYGTELSLAVRSSATAEDLPTASFAGQHESYLNVRGDEQLVDAVHKCFASIFTDRAIHYRIDQGFDHFKVFLSVAVMKMVRSDLAASGVGFTLDPESGFRDVVVINGSYGIGENVVQGNVIPDEFTVHKPTFLAGNCTVLRRRLGTKRMKMVYGEGGARTVNVPTTEEERARFCLEDAEVLTIADYALKVERHYGARAGRELPMDIEWAKDGVDGKIYLVQARPETVASHRRAQVIEEYEIEHKGRVLVRGRAVGEKIASGPVRVVRKPEELETFNAGEVLVAETTTPDWEPVMKKAAAIVTNRGGRTCHAAIVARELGIPAIVGAEGATEKLAGTGEVTVSCAEGELGRVYEGRAAYSKRTTDVSRLERPRTKIMVNLGDPDVAFTTSFLPNDGVGLARIEFIIANTIRAHPLALLHPERVEDPRERADLEALTKHYSSPAEYFIRQLAEGVGTIAAAFYPKPVVVRMSDFKSNEYAGLLGGRGFEPTESNPMLGFRGASRYTHPAYEEGFALECAAMKRVRDEMGLNNVILMIPFCRRVDEGERVVAKMAQHGLRRGENGLEIYVMCEIPNNVVQVDAFSRTFDGFSIGSNDLAQLVLGVDRDSEIVAFDYDERDPGVLEMIRLAVEGAKRNHRHSGICGQAPSDYPEMAEALVRYGIDSISLNPDSVLKVTRHVLELERALQPAAEPAVR
ncbi:MAG TPA: phosphoenolpyruvate synthase [Candidatus Dormibacteraeota bacterium]|nr:phosphoenolpyruvate synthase [Candidatus Dormibacteraeota bacterium]